MDRTVGLFEAKTHLSELVQSAENGEEIIITRRGKEVARIVPPRKAIDPTEVAKSLSRLRAAGKRLGVRKFNWKEWKSYRDEGRR